MEAFIQEERDHAKTPSSGFLKIQDIANHLGIKVSTLYSMVEQRRIPHYRIGRQIRFKRSEVDEWMEGQKEPAVEVKMEARKVIRSLQKKPDLAINEIVKKAIDETGKKGYTSRHGKPDQVKGLRKEVEDGTL